ncbi:thioredoxin family protein [Chryseobacterium carnipullorum]|uniref:thioredoxin family protein n=1 Tax=Chryseobacterium carnipullorum TaxID=1124835 RepID=UPI000E7F47B3|nr:thioredoxin family protein [Chryseobacterium carnipullorum]HBV17294.1 thioredoxin family protein [Chryseobacterium carnipullorum]
MKNLKVLMTAFIAGLGLLSFTSVGHEKEGSQKVNPASAKGYEVGDAAADFKLKNIDGKMVSLSDFKSAKGFIVVFTCNHCPYAKKYEDRIVELDKKFKDQGYPVIAVNPNDPNVQPEDGYKQMIERATQKGFTFPYLVDEGQKIYPLYGATKTPHVFVLQKENGKNIVKYIGAIDNNYDNPNDVSEYYVQDAVNALIKGEPVKMNKTVAIGCTIKVKK